MHGLEKWALISWLKPFGSFHEWKTRFIQTYFSVFTHTTTHIAQTLTHAKPPLPNFTPSTLYTGKIERGTSFTHKDYHLHLNTL